MDSNWLYFLLAALLAALSQVLLKKASLRQPAGVSFLRSLLDWRVILGYALLVSTTLLGMLGYRTVPLSVGAFLNAFSYVFVGIFSVVIFHEKMTLQKFLAYALIVLGVFVVVS